MPCHPLNPDPVAGDDFAPIEHFQQWRQRIEDLHAAQPRREELRQLVLALTTPYRPPETSSPDYRSAATLLNEKGIHTTTGRKWTWHNLRVFLGKEDAPN